MKFKALTALASALLIGSSQAALWTPAETTTALWLDADDASTITASGSDVSQWNDKSGNGRNATQGDSLAQPDTGGTHNGLNVINLDGTAEFFSLGTGLDWMDTSGTHTAFVMLNVSAAANIYGAATGGAGANSLHVGFQGATQYRMNYWGNDFNPAFPGTTTVVQNEFNLMRYNWVEGGAKTIYANAAQEVVSGATHAGNIGTMNGGGSIGNVVAQGLLGADLAEFIIVEGTPDAATTDRIEGYLAWKWGEQAKLPTGHAYENQAPQSLIPEPSSVALFGLGGLALILRRRR